MWLALSWTLAIGIAAATAFTAIVVPLMVHVDIGHYLGGVLPMLGLSCFLLHHLAAVPTRIETDFERGSVRFLRRSGCLEVMAAQIVAVTVLRSPLVMGGTFGAGEIVSVKWVDESGRHALDTLYRFAGMDDFIAALRMANPNVRTLTI